MSLDRPGFADPVAESQACFRAVLHAISHPGTIVSAGGGLAPPAMLQPATAAVLLTLADADTPLWLDAPLAGAWDWLAFHCGVPKSALGDATFACATALPRLTDLHSGTDLVPEASATVILQVATLGRGAAFRLAGPGLAAPAVLSVDGLPPDFIAQWAANHAQYPCGVDLVLCAGDRLCALPRSVQIGEG